MRIGFLGTGAMGTPMGLRLLAAGHELAVWNRSEGAAKPLIHEGAIAAGTPAEAELGADAVITMLYDDGAYEQVVFGPNGLFDALSPGALHISCSTISVALSGQLSREYAERGVDFVAAPVFGSPQHAEDGQLWVVAAGADHAVNRARPVLEAFSRGITVVGKDPHRAQAVRLGGSLLAGAALQAVKEASDFAEREGIEPQMFLKAVNDALFQSPWYAECAGRMLNMAIPQTETIAIAMKDLRLLRDAAATSHVSLSLVPGLSEFFREARRTA